MWKNLRKALEIREEQNFKDTRQNSKLWKGKKIVSVNEWKKILGGPHSLFLKYIPDTFLYTPILKMIDYNIISREKIQEWGQDYFEFLAHIKSPEYGKIKCKNCILNQDNRIRENIRNLLLKGLTAKFSFKVKFPCTIINIFECPYEQEKYNLLFVGDMGEVICNALQYAYATTQQPAIVFHVDFQAGLAGHDLPIYDLFSTIESKLSELRMPKIPLGGVAGTCSVLTDRNLLNILIEQYIESLEDGNYKKICYPITNVGPETIRCMKAEIIDFFMEIKEYVTPEELQESYSFIFRKELESKSKKSLIIFEKCSLCNNSANIHCMNCNTWT